MNLIPVTRESLDATAIAPLSEWTVYRLVRSGALRHVRVGRRVYLTPEGIAEFLAAGGEVRR